MHELSICEAIAQAVVRHAEGRRVRSVGLRVGALRQVVPDSLAFCWSIAARDPLLAGSVLDIDLVAAEVECTTCRTRRALDRFVLQCPDCQGPLSVVSGEELFIVAIDVVSEDDPPTGPPDTAGGRPARAGTKK